MRRRRDERAYDRRVTEPESVPHDSEAPAPGDGAEPDGPFSRAYTNYVLVMVLLVMIFNNMDRTVLSILVEPIKDEFDLTDTEMGAVMGLAFTLVYTFTALPVARLADYRTRRSIVAVGLFVWSAFTAATAAVQNFVQLFLMRMGVGIGEAAGTAPSVSLLSDYVPPSRRGRGVSVVSIGAVTGMGLGMILGGTVNELYGWRMAFVAAGVPGMFLALVLRLTVREPARGASEKGRSVEGESVAEVVRYLLGNRTYLLILTANAFALFAAMGRNLWEPTFLVRTYEMGTASAGIWYFVTSPVPSILGIYLGGFFADRFGVRDGRWYFFVPAIGQAISVPILIAFLLWPADDVFAMPAFVAASGFEVVPVAFVLSFIGSVFGSFFTAPFIATIQGVSKLRMRAMAAALSTMVSSFVGLAAGPLLVGVLSDHFTAEYGADALRYSLLVPTAAPLLSALVCVLGASAVAADLDRAKRS